jgi:dTDP-L-rhamnose 4-epimerase
MRVLVTGGLGFIGSALIERLLESGHAVVVLDSLTAQVHGDLPTIDLAWQDHARVRIARGDVRDETMVESLLTDCDALVHLAAETGTGQSMYQIGHYYSVNVTALAKMLELIGTRHRQVRRFVFASSRSVYGEGAYRSSSGVVVPLPRSKEALERGEFEPVGPGGEPLRLIATPESVVPAPASMYAATKLAGEVMLEIFSRTYGVGVAALRFQNVYGERQSLKNPYTGILSIFSNRLRQNLPINIFEDGLESRDFVHVSDVVQSIMLALGSDLPGYMVANVGSGVPTSVMEVATVLKRLLNSSSALEISGDYRAGDIRHCYADLSRAEGLLGYRPRIGLEEGLGRFVRWVLTQPIVSVPSQAAQSELVRLGLGRGAA